MWNNQKDESKLLENAAKIGPAMKEAAHMWHMGAHVYFPLQRYADADQQFEAAQRTDHKYLSSISEFPYIVHNYAHNANFWTHNLIEQGALKAGEKASLDLIALPLHPLYNDPRHFKTNYHSPFMQGVYGYTERLFANAYHQEFVKWYRNGLIDSILNYPALNQSNPLKLLAELIISLKENGAEETLIKQQYQRLINWPTNSFKERTNKRKKIELVDTFFEYKKAPSIHLAEKLNELKIGRGYYLLMLAQLKEYRSIIDSIYRSKSANTLLGSLYLSWAYEKNRQSVLARHTFEKTKKLAMKMDQDNPYYPIGTQLNQTLNNVTPDTDWRGQAETKNDFVFYDLKDLGPTEFPGLHIKNFRTKKLTGQEISLDELKGDQKKNILFTFVLGGRCLGCNQQLYDLYENREQFADSKIVIVSDDSIEDIQFYLEDFPQYIEAGFEFISADDHKLFKQFRVYDDFEDTAIHGTFVVNPDGEILWADRSALPFLEFPWLAKELKRLEEARNLKEKAIPYQDFPKDTRSRQ
jgi:peroxiredoxin